jgi:hypothetical protein
VSPFSAPVLGAAAVVSGPSLWGAFVDGSTSTQTALERFGICVALAWVALGLLAMLVGPPPRPARVDPVAEESADPAGSTGTPGRPG